MNETDWAIVVGVQFYPGLTDLGGPKNDAEDFRDWLLDSEGGALIPEHIKTIVAPPNKPTSLDDAEPTEVKVRRAVETIQDLAVFDPLTRRKRIGRRLYLYFAGHGFSPRPDKTMLLMADATKQHVGPPYHWLADFTAEWFYHAGYFDEILLFMDCCRENYDVPALNIPWIDVYANDFRRVRRFYAYATGWSLLSRELQDDNGVMRGVFTRSLIEGLRGGAVEANSNRITTRSLQKYLIDSIKIDSDNFLQDSDFIADNFEIISLAGAPGTFPVRINIPSQAVNCLIEVWDGSARLKHTMASGEEVWQVQLGKGLYKAVIPELSCEKLFEVNGVGESDVEFPRILD